MLEESLASSGPLGLLVEVANDCQGDSILALPRLDAG